jgi:hypothetical protein
MWYDRRGEAGPFNNQYTLWTCTAASLPTSIAGDYQQSTAIIAPPLVRQFAQCRPTLYHSLDL